MNLLKWLLDAVAKRGPGNVVVDAKNDCYLCDEHVTAYNERCFVLLFLGLFTGSEVPRV